MLSDDRNEQSDSADEKHCGSEKIERGVVVLEVFVAFGLGKGVLELSSWHLF
jgi:hypothetical protein